MAKASFPKRNPENVQQATNCFLIRHNLILLSMKKRGLGEGLWNGVGGKVDSGETVKDAAIRETKEEIGVDVGPLIKTALLHFYFPDDSRKRVLNLDVHVFFVKKWKGDPEESEEMRPRWFKKSKIPYNKMWDGDNVWISRILKGDKIEGWIKFNGNNKMIDYKIEKTAF